MRTTLMLLLGALAAPAQDVETGMDAALRRARAALSDLEATARRSGDPSAERIASLVAGLKEVMEGRRKADARPQLLVRIHLLEVPANADLLRDQRKGEITLLDGQAVRKLRSRGDVLSAPSLMVLSGERSNLQVGGRTRVPWLERRDDGTYEMKVKEVEDGIEMDVVGTLVPGEAGKRYVEVALEARVKMIVGRSPIKEDARRIGVPVVQSRSVSTSFRIPAGATAAVRFEAPEDDEVLIALVNVSVP